MALTLNTNMASLYGQMYLGNSQNNLTNTMQQLSSGLRINSAADDPAGYAITTGMTSQINGMNQATINANNAISFSQVAQGGLSQVTNVLQQMRNLAVQSANDTNSSTDRSNLDAEYQQLAAEVTRLGTATKFNGQAVFGATSHTFQVGANATDTISISSVAAVSISGDVTSQTDASNAITAIDAALGTANTAAATLGSYQNRFQAVVNNLSTSITNTSSARSQIQDTNFASATANLSKQQILQQAGTAMLAQANKLPQSILSLLQ